MLRLRLSKKRPLDEVCQDICEPERLSAIERGESKPTMKRFIRLMERLEADTCRFYPKIRTKRYDLILLATEIDMLISSRRYQEAEEELQKPKSKAQHYRLGGFCFSRKDYIDWHCQYARFHGLNGTFMMVSVVLRSRYLVSNKI